MGTSSSQSVFKDSFGQSLAQGSHVSEQGQNCSGIIPKYQSGGKVSAGSLSASGWGFTSTWEDWRAHQCQQVKHRPFFPILHIFLSPDTEKQRTINHFYTCPLKGVCPVSCALGWWSTSCPSREHSCLTQASVTPLKELFPTQEEPESTPVRSLFLPVPAHSEHRQLMGEGT